MHPTPAAPLALRKHSRSLSSIEKLEARIAPASVTVSSLRSSGPGSLHDAILWANEHPGPDLINISPRLVGVIPVPETLLITDDLAINGAPGARVILDGFNRTRVLEVDGAAQEGIEVNLVNVRIQRGVGDVGGGIYISNEGGTVTLNRSIITANRAVGAEAYGEYEAIGGAGGGIYVSSGNLVVETSQVTNNRAIGAAGLDATAGGIFVSQNATAFIRNSIISGNVVQGGNSFRLNADAEYAEDNSGGSASGGGITNFGNLTVIGTTIANNTVIGGAGLAGINGAPGSLVGADADDGGRGGNGGAAFGGGIWDTGTFEIKTSKVTGNKALGGNGGNGGAGGRGALGTFGFTFGRGEEAEYVEPIDPGMGGSGGDGGDAGGAVGGGIDTANGAIGAGTIISGNSIRGGNAGQGGLIGANGVTVRVVRPVQDYLTTDGEAPNYGTAGSAGSAFGGGVAFTSDEDYGYASVDGATISKNVVIGGNGVAGFGGLRGINGLNGSRGNSGENGTDGGDGAEGVSGGAAAGGGIFAATGLTITKSTISGNVLLGGRGGNGGAGGAGGRGGDAGARLVMYGETYVGYRGEGGQGGDGGDGGNGGLASGAGISSLADLTISNSSIFSNVATAGVSGRGGLAGVNGLPGRGAVNDGSYDDYDYTYQPVGGSDGVSVASGGGILVGGGIFTASQITVTANVARDGAGGGIYLAEADGSTIHNSTIYANTSLTAGGLDVSNANGSVEVISSIIAANRAFFQPQVEGSITAGNSLFQDLISIDVAVADGYEGNFDAAVVRLGPLAANGAPAGAPLTLKPLAGSPALNRGANPDELLEDARGFEREAGAIDIGAVEGDSVRRYVPEPQAG